MPIYTYKCNNEKCEQDTFEKLFSSYKDAENKVINCPLCNLPADKQISACNFSLKGAGFHVNDYMTPDRYVGQDAEKKWTKIHEKQNLKEKFRKENNTKHLDKAPDGSYGVTDKDLYKVNHKSESL